MAVLRFVEIDGYRMLSDHLTASYYASIESLVSTGKNREQRSEDQPEDPYPEMM